jgi:hypothetical protein
MAITIKQRAYAGMWFMAAGIIPVLYVTSLFRSFTDFSGNRNSLDVGFAFWFMIVPLFVTGMIGSLFGASILDLRKVRSGWRAALRGLLVGVIAFLLSSIIISFWIAYTDEYQNFARTLIMMVGVGLLVVGWLVVVTGVFAGWLLYQRQAPSRDKPRLP